MGDDSTSGGDGGPKGSWWSRLFQGRGDSPENRTEILGFLSECRAREVLAPDEYRMLQGVLEVSETHVREIMIPRSHMVVLPKDASPEELVKIIVESGHSRFPVIGDDRDQVVGILLAKDLLRHVNDPQGAIDLDDLIRPAVFIPESKRLNTLLGEFRESHNHMAIVVDEYGGVSGLATIEDVLEQIVGDIDDEHDQEEAEYIQDLGNGRYSVLGLTRIEDFNEHFDADLEDNEYETIAGLVIHELGRLPRRGEKLSCDGFEFIVRRGDRRRVHAVEARRVDRESGE
jgi:magnesium and cobalt transporter